MILVEKIEVDNIPCLHIVGKQFMHDKLPSVIFIHGFSSAKEHNLHYAYLLAEKGMRVLLPEAKFHGERTSITKDNLYFSFWDIVLTTIDELEIIKDSFQTRGLIDIDRIGLGGTSMGGIITLGALTKYEWIHSAVSLMGLPSYQSFAQFQINELVKKGVKLPLTQNEQEQN